MTIFEFSDYKQFLKTELRSRPNNGRGELSRLAEFLEVNLTLVSQVLSGPKDFTIEQAKKICGFLTLPKLETDYFMYLVQIERAGTQDLKNYFREKRDELKKDSLQIAKRIQRERTLTDLERSIFYSSSLYSAIYLFCSIGKGQTIDTIIERFDVSRTRAQDILQFLLSINLCVQENGLYKMGTQAIHLEKRSPHFTKHVSNWRVAAIQKSENISDEEMMFTANISLSRKDFAKVRETLMKTIQEVAETVEDSPAEDLANLNIDLFWV